MYPGSLFAVEGCLPFLMFDGVVLPDFFLDFRCDPLRANGSAHTRCAMGSSSLTAFRGRDANLVHWRQGREPPDQFEWRIDRGHVPNSRRRFRVKPTPTASSPMRTSLALESAHPRRVVRR